MDFLDLTDLDALTSSHFPTLADAQHVLTKSAAHAGFALHLSTSSKQPYLRFHCYKGSKSIRDRPVALCPCYYRLKRQPDYSYRFGLCEVHHNHDLVPEAFADMLLSDELRDYVQELHRIGVSPLKIQLALQARGVGLSCGHIHNICRPGQLQAFEDSSAELMNMVRHAGGDVAEYQESFHGAPVRVAVFTQMPDENACLSTFGDVVELDGTHGPLKMNWEIIPVTVLDRGRHVHCGGIAFAAYVTTDVILWLLQTVLNSSPVLRGLWKVLITDEDSAFIPAVELFLQSSGCASEFAHILCAMHKERNFVKKLNRCALATKDRERATKLFRQMTYSDHRSYATECLDALLAFGVPRLTKYIEKHIRPRLAQFAKSFLPAIFTAGLNTTSAAESMNRLLKVGMPGSQSLAGARHWFTTRLTQHAAELRYHMVRRRNVPSAFEEELGVSVEPEVRKKILDLIDSAKDCQVLDREGSYLVHSRRLPDVVYIVDCEDDLLKCSCSGMMQNGYPCVHQLAVFFLIAHLPALRYFNPRWFVPEAALSQGERQQGEETVWNQDDMASDDDIDTVNHEDGTEQSLPEVHDWDIETTVAELPGMSQRSVYLTLFHLAKGICSLAARDHERSCRLVRTLHDLRMQMMTPGAEAGQADGHVHDVRDALARPRGRPKTREIPNATVRAAKAGKAAGIIVSCELCEGSHDLSACPDQDIVFGARLQNGPVIPAPGQRKCALCWGYGHQKRTCPCRRELKTRRDEAELPPDESD